MILVHFQGKPFNITVIQVYDLTTDVKKDEVEGLLGRPTKPRANTKINK